jgi:3-isopropylmalate/(R)-2-methylmalate dehydratase large subunit
MIIAGADGHVATSGGFGAIAFSLKPEEMVLPLATGILEIDAPEVVQVEVQRHLKPPSSPRDLALTLTGLLGRGLARGKAVLFSGEGVWDLSSSGKMTVCNMIGETGAVTGLIVPREISEETEKKDLVLNAEEVKLVAACPAEPANVRPVADLVGLPVTQVVVGGCSSGRREDMIALIKALNGRKVHPKTNLIVTPASAKVAEEMDAEGLTKTLRSAGAVINTPGCGPCAGQHLGLLETGDRVVATIVRNTPGRMGAPEAEIYLASPWTAGLAAAAGSFAID